MTQLTQAQLVSIVGKGAKSSIITGVITGLPLIERFGILPPHRLAHFLAQIAHESARMATTKEYASGAAYEGRRDLGNTQPGDGKKFKGHGLIQVTGRANHRAFWQWIKQNGFPKAPNFELQPDLAAEFPWALIGAVWYWTTRNLNNYADVNNIEMITRRINGGLNGYNDRLDLYTRSGLVLLGYPMKAGVIKEFQKDAGLMADDIPGPKTRAAIHDALKKLGQQAERLAPLPDPPDVPIEHSPVEVKRPQPDFEAPMGRPTEQSFWQRLGAIFG